MSKRAWGIIGLVVGGLVLCLYPFVLIANIMQLANFGATSYSILTVISILFIFLSSSYILTYVVCLICYIVKKGRRQMFAVIPLIHLLAVVLLFLIWALIE